MTDNSSPGKSMGKSMLVLSWILILAGLTYFFSDHEENRYNPNQDLSRFEQGEKREVVLKRNPYGHYVLNGEINGQPVTFMLDTGATQVAIPAALGDKLGLARGYPYEVSTANGNVQVWGTTLDKVSLGPIELFDVRAALNPGMSGNEILLGMSVLKALDFSQRGNELTLRQQPY